MTLSYAVAEADAATGDYVITFAPAAESIALSSALDFSGAGTNVWIVGPASINCSDGGSFSVGGGTTVNISGLTISHEASSFDNDGVLNLSSCTFTENAGGPQGGAIENDGTMTVVSSTFSDNSDHDGGAISNLGTLTVTSSTFSGNYADYLGGAIQNAGTLSVTSCTIADNTALVGGGIYNYPGGAVSIASSTIAGNTASWSNDGGGICNDSTLPVTIVNTIVAGNTSSGAPDIEDTYGTVSASHSLVESAAGNDVTATDGNIVGVDPDLGSLADNGAATETMALAADSPILGAGIGADQTAVGAGNRLLFDGTYFLTYDAAGNRTAQFKSDSGVLDSTATDITVYTWNNDNELTSATHYATASDYGAGTYTASTEYAITYGNDAFGRMVTRALTTTADDTTTTTTENFIYNGQNIALVLAADGSIIERELTGTAADQVFATEAVVSGVSTVNWLLTDNQGTVRDVVQYGSRGRRSPGLWRVRAVGVAIRASDAPTFYFNGTWQDPQTGLNDMGARWYDAVDSVFASYDPLGFNGGQTNTEEFVGDSPTNGTDPTGMADLSIHCPSNLAQPAPSAPAPALGFCGNYTPPVRRFPLTGIFPSSPAFAPPTAPPGAVGTTQNSVPGTPSVTVPVTSPHTPESELNDIYAAAVEWNKNNRGLLSLKWPPNDCAGQSLDLANYLRENLEDKKLLKFWTISVIYGQQYPGHVSGPFDHENAVLLVPSYPNGLPAYVIDPFKFWTWGDSWLGGWWFPGLQTKTQFVMAFPYNDRSQWQSPFPAPPPLSNEQLKDQLLDQRLQQQLFLNNGFGGGFF